MTDKRSKPTPCERASGLPALGRTTIAALREARGGNLQRFDSLQALMAELNNGFPAKGFHP